MTNVDLQGKQGCKYVIGFYYSPKPKRVKFTEGWPSDAEENLERLADAGEPMDNFATLCRNCNGTVSAPLSLSKTDNSISRTRSHVQELP